MSWAFLKKDPCIQDLMKPQISLGGGEASPRVASLRTPPKNLKFLPGQNLDKEYWKNTGKIEKILRKFGQKNSGALSFASNLNEWM